MPCTDGGVPYPDHDKERILGKVRKLEAMLCALADAISRADNSFEIIASINWQESGVTARDVADWLRDHRRLDQERKARVAKGGNYAP